MLEVWLRPNRTAIYFGLIPPGMLAVAGLICTSSNAGWLRAIGWVSLATAGLLAGLMVQQLRQPRLAYRDGRLLVYLRLGPPIRVPIEIVEGFFLGSGPLKLTDSHDRPQQTVNLVVRLSDKATEWTAISVKPALGKWEEGYISIRGAWCERLTLKVVERLNVRLHEIQHASPPRAPKAT